MNLADISIVRRGSSHQLWGTSSCTMYLTDFMQLTKSGDIPFQDVPLGLCCALFWPVSCYVITYVNVGGLSRKDLLPRSTRLN